MSIVQQTLDYQRDTEENKKRIRKMVLDSYKVIYIVFENKGVALWTWKR